MLDLVPDLRGWLGGGALVALARVVDLDGSGPRLPGAAMAISDDGRVAGSVSGGCIESAVVTEALDVLDDGAARLVRFGYSDDDAVAVGLTCGGTVHVFIEVVTASRWAAIERIAAAVAEDRPAAVATVVAGPGAGAWVDLAGDRAGDRAVPADATADRAQAGAAWAGSLGDPGLDRVVRRDVIGEMASGRSGVRRYGSSGEAGADDVAVFIETFAPPPRMIIFGAIDFTAALARVGKILGFHVTVCDARVVFATSLRFPMADQVLVDWPHRYLDRCGAALGANDAVCVLTHDHKFDVPAIAAAGDAVRLHRRARFAAHDRGTRTSTPCRRRDRCGPAPRACPDWSRSRGAHTGGNRHRDLRRDHHRPHRSCRRAAPGRNGTAPRRVDGLAHPFADRRVGAAR